MTDIEYQAKQYALSVLNHSVSETFSREEMYHFLVEAYEHGARGGGSGTIEGYLKEAGDCRYFSEGNCMRYVEFMPQMRCDRMGCVVYSPKEKNNNE